MKAKPLHSLIKYSSLSVRSLFNVTSFSILEAVVRQSIHLSSQKVNKKLPMKGVQHQLKLMKTIMCKDNHFYT